MWCEKTTTTEKDSDFLLAPSDCVTCEKKRSFPTHIQDVPTSCRSSLHCLRLWWSNVIVRTEDDSKLAWLCSALLVQVNRSGSDAAAYGYFQRTLGKSLSWIIMCCVGLCVCGIRKWHVWLSHVKGQRTLCRDNG